VKKTTRVFIRLSCRVTGPDRDSSFAAVSFHVINKLLQQDLMPEGFLTDAHGVCGHEIVDEADLRDQVFARNKESFDTSFISLHRESGCGPFGFRLSALSL